MQKLFVFFIVAICAVAIGRRVWKSLQPGAKSQCGCDCSGCNTGNTPNGDTIQALESFSKQNKAQKTLPSNKK